MAPHSSTLAWKIPWTEEPGRLQSTGLLESDMTERLPFHFSLSCVGEGNGNPLQCMKVKSEREVAQSCLTLICGAVVLLSLYIYMLLLLLSRFSRVQLCVTPETAAHQASPSLGFSRQEHWGGLPFPSPVHESEK